MGKCSSETCNRSGSRRGYCNRCYRAKLRSGEIELVRVCNTRPSPEQRFALKFKRGSVAECWEWSGLRNPQGYGHFFADGSYRFAHRFSWTLKNGAIADGLFVLHRCDNPSCVNPRHLFLGTQKDNMRDCASKGRSQRGESHAKTTLSESAIIEMRDRFAAGSITMASLAREYGLDPSSVFGIVNRRTWKHI